MKFKSDKQSFKDIVFELDENVAVKYITTLDEADKALRFFAFINMKDNPLMQQIGIDPYLFYLSIRDLAPVIVHD